MEVARTERLIIRWLTPDDAPFFRSLVNSPGWIKYIGQRNIHTDAEALAYLEAGIFKSYKDYNYGFYMVETKDGHLPLGICGIVNRGTLPGPDFGFAYMPEYMGHGYATEAAIATLEHVKNDVALKELYAITLPENNPSIRLLEKMGFQQQSMIRLPNDPVALLLYRKDMEA